MASTGAGPTSASEVTRPSAGSRPAAHERILDSATLLQGTKSVLISHGGELYRLQATRQGKLILTK